MGPWIGRAATTGRKKTRSPVGVEDRILLLSSETAVDTRFMRESRP